MVIEFFNTIYGQLTIVATFFGTMWGLLKALGALTSWLKQKSQALKVYKQAPQASFQAIKKIQEKLDDTKKQLVDLVDMQCKIYSDRLSGIYRSIDTLNKSIYNNNECTATIMLQIMMKAYHKHIIDGQPVSLDVRTALCEMFEKYKMCEWHNHIPDDFAQKLMKCQVIK